jgi:hypothetical protein
MAKTRKNWFADATNFAELYGMFKIATSAENLSAGGKRTSAEIDTHYAQLRADFEARDVELYDSLTNTYFSR